MKCFISYTYMVLKIPASPKLLKGDCLQLMPELPESSVDLILCDLPYGLTECKWDITLPFEKLWEQYHRIIRPKEKRH